MGSIISTVVFQPLLLGTAIMMIIVALIYQNKSTACGTTTDEWGKDVFKIEMIMAIMIIITAVIINFFSGLEI